MLQAIISPAKQMATNSETFLPKGIPPFPAKTARLVEALRALEAGESVGKVYRRYFLAGGDAAEQAEANLGLGLPQGERLTAEQIERISAQVDRTGRYDLSGY